nr:IS66 family transposase [Caballeronia calidae]
MAEADPIRRERRLAHIEQSLRNSIRPFFVGRRGWLFSDTVDGANASANLYALVETCNANSIDPYRHLTWLFQRLPLAKTVDDYDALLPGKIPADLRYANAAFTHAARRTSPSEERRLWIAYDRFTYERSPQDASGPYMDEVIVQRRRDLGMADVRPSPWDKATRQLNQSQPRHHH